MNPQTKEKIAAKVILAIETENLMNVQAAKNLGINPAYLSMIKKHEQFDKCPEVAWVKMHEWYHSGLPLKEYKPTDMKVIELKPDQEPEEVLPKPSEGIVHHKTVFIPAEEINRRLRELRVEKPKTKKNPPKGIKPAKSTKPPVKTGDELIADVISHIGFEIDVIVKLKRS